MSEEQKLGVNLQWALEDVGCCDNFDYLDSGIAEVAVAEDGFAQVEIIPMIAEAAEKIQELEKQLAELQARFHSLSLQSQRQDEEIKKLDDSISKHEIKILLGQARDVSSWVSNNDAYKHLRDELKQLLPPPAKENNQ